MQDSIAALKTEVVELRSFVEKLSAGDNLRGGDGATNGEQWSDIVRSGRGRNANSKRHLTSTRNSRPNHHQRTAGREQVARKPILNSSRERPDKTKVVGARRVWGTMPFVSVNAVSACLSKLTTLGEQISVRRKYRTRGSDQAQWWFVVKGNEKVLEELETQWERVQLHTACRPWMEIGSMFYAVFCTAVSF